MGHVLWARDLARRLLEEPLPRRWAHTQGVAQQAETLAGVLGGDADLVAASAWLHDIGYSPALVATGFHPLDGARYLRSVEHTDERLCSLVAHHSGALVEAEERGLRGDLAGEFELPRSDLLEALTYSDMTTGPDGTHLPVEQRLSEILTRYEPGDIVHRSITRSSPDLLKAVQAVKERLSAAD
ncbi:putative nucleotidyltransferase with HDIG domain [Spinactinospora alkalitolerans]|uniref:Putative nucleotidyltransferase with HDIG domain n=1 Tax=Spinactinospora alkalitolerans TaxID=687207 RepID=A0A852U3Y5_9ACTN|nr:HD domain-containing protein [Spinactinospora alkalitolerans]NYE50192.1 putative nucleotidyltransferase with HDIG domain [Spinactinospora alkalitolerans]